MNIKKLNEELEQILNEKVEKTFADWFGQDLTGQTYKGDIVCAHKRLTSLKGSPKIVLGDFIKTVILKLCNFSCEIQNCLSSTLKI